MKWNLQKRAIYCATRKTSGAMPDGYCTLPPLGAIGCTIVEGSDSSVTFEKDGKRTYFHRSHPQRDALIYRVKAAREYLLKLEITP